MNPRRKTLNCLFGKEKGYYCIIYNLKTHIFIFNNLQIFSFFKQTQSGIVPPGTAEKCTEVWATKK